MHVSRCVCVCVCVCMYVYSVCIIVLNGGSATIVDYIFTGMHRFLHHLVL